ncbi:MAG: hypothetical protein ACREPE_01770 [Lysobacter sp.]
MRTRTAAIIAIAMAAATPAFAGELVDALTHETGMTERQVLMIIGNRTPYVESRSNYSRSLAQFKRALGSERAEELIAGRTIVLQRHPEVRVATLDQRRTEDRMP